MLTRVSEAEKKGTAGATNAIARVVAADIDLWFRRDGLGPQEALVDVPHLLMRFPFLLGASANDLDAWNQAVIIENEPFRLDSKLYTEQIRSAKFVHDCWIPSPCFWWPQLKENEHLNEKFFEAKEGEWLDAVFCEDRSAFSKREEDNLADTPVEFSAEFEGSWGRRFVKRIEGICYAPRSRFAI